MIAAHPIGAVHLHRARPRLTTRLFLLAAIIPLVLMADPTDQALGLSTTQQFIPVAIALLAGLFSAAAGLKAQGGLTWQDFAFSLVILMMVLGGVGTALQTGDLTDSFARLSFIALIFFPFRILASQPDELRWFLRRFSVWIVGVSILMSLQLIYWQVVGPFFEPRRSGIYHIFHEEVFLLPVAVMIVHLSPHRSAFLRAAAILLLLTGTLFSFKNTGFLVFVLAALLLFCTASTRDTKMSRKFTMIRAIVGFYAVLAVAVLLVLLPFFRDQLPGGSTLVRFYTYGLRWEQFLDAPLFGLGFWGTPLISVPNTNLIIPSHSDFLDLLAFGGLFGALAYLLPLISFLLSFRRLDRLREERVAALAIYTLVAAIHVVWLFNPVWLQPKMGVLLWAGLGLLAGIHSRARHGSP